MGWLVSHKMTPYSWARSWFLVLSGWNLAKAVAKSALVYANPCSLADVWPPSLPPSLVCSFAQCASIQVVDISWLSHLIYLVIWCLLWWMFSHGFQQAVESLSHFMSTANIIQMLLPQNSLSQSSTLFSSWPWLNNQAIFHCLCVFFFLLLLVVVVVLPPQATSLSTQTRWPGMLPKVLAIGVIFPYNVFQCQSAVSENASQSNVSLHLYTELAHPWPKFSYFSFSVSWS